MNAGSAERRDGGPVASSKITPRHLDRLAIVYVRQSHAIQIIKNPESTRVQYSLTEHAVGLGWSRERVLVIDEDQAHTATTSEGRLGFQRLVAEVGLGHVGIIVGFQMSRLARSCSDWYQLIDACALFGTLLGDFDGIYDPAIYNDRLLLGLKGTISEAELYLIKQRMHSAKLAKAQRGELGMPRPIGYVTRASGEVVKDPDEQARHVVELLFEQFQRRGTIQGVLCYLLEHDLKLPVRIMSGPDKGELRWSRPSRSTLQQMFINPAYAGAYVYGRRSTDPRAKLPGHPATRRRDAQAWAVCLRDKIPAYISWEHYEQNQRQLELNDNATRGVPREGATLLAGLVLCGRCGHRMQVSYNGGYARYACVYDARHYAAPLCQSLAARPVDEVVEALVLRALAPSALELSLAVASDLEQERAREEKLWQQRLERAHYDVERARRQYDAVEPENRLVVRTLERTLEERLGAEQKLREEYHRACATRPVTLTDAERSAIRALATELPKLWNSPTTTNEQRKDVVRQLLDEARVTVEGESERVELTLRWAGGHETTTTLTRPVAKLSQLSYHDDLMRRAAQLQRDGESLQQIADSLNAEGWRPAKQCETFSRSMAKGLLPSRGTTPPQRSIMERVKLKANEWTMQALAVRLHMPRVTLHCWRKRGWIRARWVPIPRPVGAWIIWADDEELERLAARRRPSRKRWPRRPQAA